MEALGLNFAVVLFTLVVITGIVYLAEIYIFRRQREAAAAKAVAALDAQAGATDSAALAQKRDEVRESHLKQPFWIEYPVSFFPVILIVFLLRSFLVEPFKIPSGSMLPTLLVGDFILVNKFTYGVRIPIINKKVVELNNPQRGDVMVFRYPNNPAQDYIKRVVGTPGDTIEYREKKLTINGVEAGITPDGEFSYVGDNLSFSTYQRLAEKFAEKNHSVLWLKEFPPVRLEGVEQFQFRENCVYNDSGFTCKVPQGHYFMMGDNRDSSSDSRYWGFVPDRNIVGKAFLIWWNFDEMKRIGSSIN